MARLLRVTRPGASYDDQALGLKYPGIYWPRGRDTAPTEWELPDDAEQRSPALRAALHRGDVEILEDGEAPVKPAPPSKPTPTRKPPATPRVPRGNTPRGGRAK